ncbi:MAG TPA: PfkB family carbohydrate kinase [Tepidisphaeraceae bacterium]|nr:PfkB family carbohydrate kinase [Tepidisphaeraceae bacterium]
MSNTAHRKICSLPQLLEFRRSATAAGKTIVHCHGCFDIVHPGHIHYLQFARSLGDALIVTVSADPQVNKGINRPLIPDDLRAASLAALECVDCVYINPHPTAVEVLDALKPDIYVKGREYERNEDPRFLAERDTVTRNGGRVVFSSGDVIYSSTALIGAMDATATLFNDQKVGRFRQQFDLSAAALSNLVLRCRGKRMVVVGDYICDRYHFCDATGVASEGPMMTLRPLQSEQYDGAAAIIARHLAGLGADATLITSLADDDASRQVVARLTEAGVTVRALRQRKQLVSKSRYLVDQTKLLKVDEGATTPLDSRSVDEAAWLIEEAATDAAGVIFADFGYGLITGPLLDRVMPIIRPRVPLLTADVSGRQSTLLRFKDVDLLCPTEREVRQTLNNFSSGLNAVVYELLATTAAKTAMITLGKQGLCLFDQQQQTNALSDSWDRKLRTAYLPAMASHPVDPLGCGDALLAIASLALAAGGSPQAAAYLGSLAAAIEVQQIGNQPVTAEQLLDRINPSALQAHYEPARLAS